MRPTKKTNNWLRRVASECDLVVSAVLEAVQYIHIEEMIERIVRAAIDGR